MRDWLCTLAMPYQETCITHSQHNTSGRGGGDLELCAKRSCEWKIMWVSQSSFVYCAILPPDLKRGGEQNSAWCKSALSQGKKSKCDKKTPERKMDSFFCLLSFVSLSHPRPILKSFWGQKQMLKKIPVNQTELTTECGINCMVAFVHGPSLCLTMHVHACTHTHLCLLPHYFSL